MAKDALQLVADVMTLLVVWVWDGRSGLVVVDERLSYPKLSMRRKSLPELQVALFQLVNKLL